MGKVIKQTVKGLSFWGKFSLTLTLTLLLNIFMYHGWYKPKSVQATVVTLTTGTSWTAPAGVTSIFVECWGGGGGGGRGNSASFTGGGGGGGAYSSHTMTVTPGNSYAYSLGAAGTGASGGTTDGGAGGNTYFIDAATVMAVGGSGGIGAGAGGTGGNGGVKTSCVGNGVKYSGGAGKTGTATVSGGGGGSAGSAADGNAATGQAGAGAVTDGGPGGAGGNSAANGAAPVSGPGGGGGGGGVQSGGAESGGNGFAGQIRITYTADSTPPTVSSVTVQSGLTVDVAFSEAMGTGVATASNYTVSGTGKGTLTNNPTSVALVSGNTYRLTWSSGEMVNGGNITITVANAQDANGNAIGSPNSGTHTGGGIGTAPTVSTVAVQTGLTVDVAFSEAMGTGVTTASNYTVSGTGKGTLANNPTSVALVSGNTYRLTWSSGEMVTGLNVTITVASVQDAAGNPIGSPNSGTHTGGGLATPPTVSSVAVQSGLTVDVTFSEAMGTGVTTASNYTVSGTGKGTLANNPTNVVLVSGSTYRLSWSSGEMVNGGNITITVANVQDANGNLIGSPNSATHTGGAIGTAPTVSTVAVTSGLTVDVTFTEAMGTGVTTGTNYTVSGTGKGTLANNPNSVALVSGSTYRLTWSSGEMLSGGNITITVANVQDVAGNTIGSPSSGTHTGGAVGTAPAVSSTVPTSGATGVTPNANVAINFSEPVNCATVTTSSVTINPAVSWSLDSCSGSTAVFTPSGQTNSTVYTVTVGTGVTDSAGNPMASAYPFSYTTSAPAAINGTTCGTATAAQASGTSIQVTMPYTDDANGNNNYTVEYKDGAGAYGYWLPNPHGHAGSPFTTTITGLTGGHSYTVRVTYNDSDGIVGGTQVQTLGPITLPAAGESPLLHNSNRFPGSTKWGGNWGTSSGQYGAIACETCHQAGSNIKDIRANITAPSGSFPGQTGGSTINFQSRTAPNGFGNDERVPNTSSTYVCEYCHSVTSVHRYNASGQTDFNHKSANNTNCLSCHPHNTGFKASCATCHGFPPTTSSIGGPNGLASLATGALPGGEAGAHGIHVSVRGFACEACHNGYTVNPMGNQKIEIGFALSGSTIPGFKGTVASGTFTGNLNANLTNGYTWQSPSNSAGTVMNSAAATTTCSVWCHGNWSGSGGTATTASWTGGASQAACGACHGKDAASVPTAGSHATHAGSAAGQMALACSQCHGTDPTNNDHVNGKVLWNLNTANARFGASATYKGFANQSSAVPSTYGQCGNIYCHSSGQSVDGASATPVYASTPPTWGNSATAACGSCHGTSGLTTGSHTKHLTLNNNCGNCHTDASLLAYTAATHVDGSIDVSGSYTKGGTPGNGYGTCSTASCHNDGTSNPSQPQTPQWGQNGTACAVCHAAIPATGAHAKHVSGSLYKLAVCGDCHTGASAGTSGGDAHLDTNIDVKPGMGYGTDIAKHLSGTYSGSCSTTYCHSSGQSADGASATPVYASTPPTWGGSAACGSCHATTTFTTGSHTKHLAVDPNCGNCHSGATAGAYDSTSHVDGSIDVGIGGYTAPGVPGNGYGTCATASCHDAYGTTGVATPTWAQTSNCGSCHAASPATGSHTKHVSTSLYKLAACGDCHTGATASSGGTGHYDNNVDVSTGGYPTNIAKHTAGSGYSTCATSYCHSSGQSADGLSATPVYASTPPTWGNPATAACGSCHATSALNTGSHQKHVSIDPDCGKCHTGWVSDAYDSTAHVDGSINVGVGAYTAAGTPGNGYGSCSTTACHPNVYAAGNGTTPTWGVSSGCSACHSVPIDATGPNTGTHAMHMALGGAACTQCHAAGTTATTKPSSGHVNGVIDVAVGAYPSTITKHAAGSGYATASCSTTTCHGSGTKTWGANTGNASCTKCHGKGTVLANYSTTNAWQAAPGYDVTGVDINGQAGTVTNGVSNDQQVGAHDAHLRAVNGYSDRQILCTDCHGPVPGSKLHANGTTDYGWSNLVQNVGTTGSVSSRGTLGPGYAGSTCSNMYCHGAVLNGGNGKTPVWNDTTYTAAYAKNATNCGRCHGAPPTAATGFTLNYNHGGVSIDNSCSGCHGHNGNGPTHINGSLEASGGSCDSCHSYDTVGGVWGNGTPIGAKGWGAHARHIDHLKALTGTTLDPNSDTYGSAAFNAVCGVCHNQSDTNHSMGGDGSRVIDFNGDTTTYTYGSGNPTYNSGTWTCSNISCHFGATPAWQ